MVPLQIYVITVLAIIVSLPSFICSIKEAFVCDSQRPNYVKGDEPILAVWYGVISQLVCGLLCKISTNSCTAFRYTPLQECYLYGNVASPVLPKHQLACQRANSLPMSTLATSTVLPAQISTMASISSVTVTIKNVRYANLSCYPQKLFAGSIYTPSIPIGKGSDLDCKCEGSLYVKGTASIVKTATTFADCFIACENVPSPPCQAFSFTEANSTCVIGKNTDDGDTTDKGVLKCYV